MSDHEVLTMAMRGGLIPNRVLVGGHGYPLVWGRNDGVVPPAYADEFRRHLPAASVALLDGSGHLPHREEPERFTEVVSRFLQD